MLLPLIACCGSFPPISDENALNFISTIAFIIKFIVSPILTTVGPLIIESFQAKKRVSTGALGALDDPFVVQTKI